MARMCSKYVMVIFCCLHHLAIQEKLDNNVPKLSGDDNDVKKSTTIYDYHTRMTAYKDLVGSGCYIEFIKNGEPSLSQRIREYPLMKLPNKLYISEAKLSKRRIWELAGSRIWEFCRGFPTYLIQEVQNKDSNDISTDNDIIKSRLRRKRSTRHYFVGRLRGQTQSQYLNFGHSNNSSGKAEAESTYGTSRATVVGTNGMGQAQSQSSTYDCDECYRPIKTSEYPPVGRPEFGSKDRTHEPGELTSGKPGEHRVWPTPDSGIGKIGVQKPGIRYPIQPGDSRTEGGIYTGNIIPKQPGDSTPGIPGIHELPRKVEGGHPQSPDGTSYPHGRVKGKPDVVYPGIPGSERYPVSGPGQSGVTIPSSPVFPLQPEQRYPTPSDRNKYPVTFPGSQKDIFPGADGFQRPGSTIAGRPGVDGISVNPSISEGRYPNGYIIEGQTRPQAGRYPIESNNQNPERIPGTPGRVQQHPIIIPNYPAIPGYPVVSPASVTPPPTVHYPNGPRYPGTNSQHGFPSNIRYPGLGEGGIPGVTATSSDSYPGRYNTQRYPGATFVPASDITGTSGNFGGDISGHTGRFSGQFSGVFDVNGQRMPQSHTYHPERTNPTYPGYYPTTGQEIPTTPSRTSNIYPAEPATHEKTHLDGRYPEAYDHEPGYQRPREPLGPPLLSTHQPTTVSTGPSQYPDQGQYQPRVNVVKWQPSPGAEQRPYQTGNTVDPGGYQPVSAGSQYAPGENTEQSPYRPGESIGQEKYAPYHPGGGSGQGQYQHAISTEQGQHQQDVVGRQGHYKPSTDTELSQFQPGQSKFEPGVVPGHVRYPHTGSSGLGQYPEGAGLGQDQYRPGSVTGQGQYIPVMGNVQDQRPGASNGQGQYIPGSGTSQEQSVPRLGTGHVQYTPGVSVRPGQLTSGSSIRQGQYTPSAGAGQGQYAPGTGTGRVQYTPGVSTWPGQITSGSAIQQGQYTPVTATGQRQYATGTGNGDGRYEPGVSTTPGQFTSGVGIQQGQYEPVAGIQQGQYTPAGTGQVQYSPAASGPGEPVGGTEDGQYASGSGTGNVRYTPGVSPGTGQFIPGADTQQGQYSPEAATGQREYTPGASTGQQGGMIGQPSKSTNESGDSQAQTSVQQTNNETQASAQAQGKFESGTAQSQVSGTYSGTGSFSASAGSDDGKRGALTQVSGGKQGATSSAQGRGGRGKSQAQMQLFSDTGKVLSKAQSGGPSHSSQTQVQGGEEGGIANAQSNGSGRTSSQAQIGFSPYKKANNEEDSQKNFFLGGGSASAQGGFAFGQSQSQIQGKFRYGIKYTGGAQAQSGNGMNRNFSFIPFEPTMQITPIGPIPQSLAKNEVVVNRNSSESDIEQNKNEISTTTEVRNDEDQSTSDPPTDGDNSAEYDYEENETENPPINKVIAQTRDGQTQHILLPHMRNLDANVVQSHFNDYHERVFQPGDTFQPGEVIPGTSGYRIPIGFRAKVKSVASPSQTYALGKNSQAQTVTITPGTGKIIYQKHRSTSKDYYNGYRSSYSSYKPYQNYFRSGENAMPNFLSISKSETGYENPVTGKRVSSTHFTQSSTCGLITNTCIFRKTQRICLPNITRNSDGSIRLC